MRIVSSRICYLLISTILLLPSVSLAQSHVGVSSTLIDLGTLSRGSENIAKFNLVTSSRESFTVSLEKEPSTSEFFSRKGYENYLLNYSEQNIMSWINLFSDSVQIEAIDEEQRTGPIGAKKEVNFIVNVPEDAEPGYHIFRIKPLPTVSPDNVGAPVGAMVISVTTVSFLFNIEGRAVRDGIILDVVPGNIVDNRFVTNTYFQNTGTTSITAKVAQRIYKDGELITRATSGDKMIKPDEVKTFKILFPKNKLSEGDYEVVTLVNFLSDSVSKNSTIYISAALPPEEEKPKPPFWLLIVLIVIIVMAFIIYKIY